MKKLLYCLSAMMVIFLAGSCQQELNPVTDGDTNVTFTVNAGDVATRADIADGTNVDILYWEIYKDVTAAPLGEGSVKKTSDKNFTVELKLLADQDYTIIFWAEVENGGHYNTEDLRNVEIVSYDDEMANDESRAAFFRVYEFSTENGKAINEDVYLYRPFSQINLGTTTYATSFTGGNVVVETTEMTVTNIATSFNTLDGVGEGEQEVTFQAAATPNGAADRTEAKLIVNDLSYYWIGMNYLIVNGESDNVTVDVTIKTQYGDVNHIVESVPVKENFRTNLLGNFLTTGATFNVIVDEKFQNPDEVIVLGSTVVRNSAELAAALKEDKEYINVYLDEVGNAVTRAGEKTEFVIEIGAWTKEYYFGGASTKSITINANGNTLRFNHNNTDWNYIRCVNDDAKWIINDATLTNSGKNDGPWNRHDIRFYNAVELNNVTSDKAIALLNDGKLTNVAISDVHPNNSEAYGLWISAEGQTVDLDGVSIIAHETKSTDRGIAIKDQYVDTPAKVTLNVKNSTFKTQKKAAVLVTSTAGAVINWGRGNDITGVAADPANAVWVDGGTDYQNIEDVTVTGASVIIEGQVSSTPVVTNAEELKAAIAAANNDKQTVILLKAGTYTGAFDIDGKNVALIGEDDVVIDGLVFGLGASHILLRNITLTNEHPVASGSARHKADYFCLGAYAAAFVIEDCVFNVSNQGNAAGKGAINIGDGFNAYSASDEYELIVRNTVFNCNGERPIRAKTSSWIEGCTFVDQYRYAIQVQGNNQAATEKVIFKNNIIVDPCTTSGEPFAAGVQISQSQLCENVAFNISGNTLDSELFDDLKLAYDHDESKDTFGNIKITTCTLNGKQITEGQCVEIDAETNEVLPEALYVKEGENTYVISTAAGLFWFANEVNVNGNPFSGKTVKLAAGIDLENAAWTPIGQTGATQFKGTFDGQNHTISNLNVDALAQTGGNYSSGLFGWLNAAVVKNVKVDGATVKGNHNVGVIGGYLETSGCTIENCHVANAAVECHVANVDANGDKCGVIVGHAGNAGVVVKGCTATESTVSAGRDAGQIVGAAKEANVTDCSATNVTVTANGEGTGANIRNEVIGRLL